MVYMYICLFFFFFFGRGARNSLIVFHMSFSYDNVVAQGESFMADGRRQAFEVPSCAQTAVLKSGQLQQKHAKNTESQTEEWHLFGQSSPRSRRTPQKQRAVHTPPTPRGRRWGSPNSMNRSESTQRYMSLPSMRCKYCFRPLAPGETAEHDRYCSLKPLACTKIDSKTGTVCGYICRGRNMLLDHEAHCHAKKSRPHTHCKEIPEHHVKAVVNDSHIKSGTSERLMCSSCGTLVNYPAALARHRMICPEVEVLCPLMCGKTFRRGEVAQHVKQQALEHAPMPVPNLANCAGDDPKVVLALVMNMLLERAGIFGEGGLNTQRSNETPSLGYYVSGSHSSILETGRISDSGRPSFVPPKSAQTKLAMTSSPLIDQNHCFDNSPQSAFSLPEKMPIPRLIVPEPTGRGENCGSSVNKLAGMPVYVKDFSFLRMSLLRAPRHG
ncbi:hypothetical protein, conserved [Trypanosoma cruzi]|uniref:TRAF-type domain-containing protein n=1 Tax=Trypanosoma cruzi (strain CL Brener) TaxID=353153 RepID=Q4E3L1_TRYCC|nr:hypothetical protein, conserved [Trypanosoma cruzi]EAN99328.1 hypothetical protein, conserved [Trypanosoma cruzi]|eukprot:XP_821179.1 hypothetical protein [Trypanosoma cruzi strain CL Brener]